MATKSIQIELSEEARNALIPLGEWLSRQVRFRTFENYELCEDNEGLVNNAREFIACFTPSIKVQHLRI